MTWFLGEVTEPVSTSVLGVYVPVDLAITFYLFRPIALVVFLSVRTPGHTLVTARLSCID